MGLKAAVGEMAPCGERNGIDLLEEIGFLLRCEEIGDVIG